MEVQGLMIGLALAIQQAAPPTAPSALPDICLTNSCAKDFPGAPAPPVKPEVAKAIEAGDGLAAYLAGGSPSQVVEALYAGGLGVPLRSTGFSLQNPEVRVIDGEVVLLARDDNGSLTSRITLGPAPVR